ncbi:hypothetical protein SNEBB_009502 [Seison nebaliae]|nr:hypothetical protein SNEBB_009502 [Seison nebaliae]
MELYCEKELYDFRDFNSTTLHELVMNFRNKNTCNEILILNVLDTFPILLFACVAFAMARRPHGKHGRFGNKGKFIDRLLGCEELQNCSLECEFGLKRAEDTFCRVCECDVDPCAGVTCPSNKVCKVFKKHFSSCVNEAFYNKMQELKKQKMEYLEE